MTFAIVVFAAFFAGFVDAIAGGGGLITVPALLGAGLPPHLVFGTNKGQAVFGATASLYGFWRRGLVDRERAAVAVVVGLCGSLAGAWLLLRIPSEPLKPIISVLLGFAVLLTFVRRPAPRTPKGANVRLRVAALGLLLGAYDGFFGPGTGTFLVLGFTLFLGDSLTRASANAKVINWASNLAAMALFAIRGTVVWKLALPMAAANALGASLGARAAVHVGDNLVRWVLRIVSVALIAKLLLAYAPRFTQ